MKTVAQKTNENLVNDNIEQSDKFYDLTYFLWGKGQPLLPDIDQISEREIICKGCSIEQPTDKEKEANYLLLSLASTRNNPAKKYKVILREWVACYRNTVNKKSLDQSVKEPVCYFKTSDNLLFYKNPRYEGMELRTFDSMQDLVYFVHYSLEATPSSRLINPSIYAEFARQKYFNELAKVLPNTTTVDNPKLRGKNKMKTSLKNFMTKITPISAAPFEK